MNQLSRPISSAQQSSSHQFNPKNIRPKTNCHDCGLSVCINKDKSLRKHQCYPITQQSTASPSLTSEYSTSSQDSISSTQHSNQSNLIFADCHLDFVIGTSPGNLISLHLDLSTDDLKAQINQLLNESYGFYGDKNSKINELARLLKVSSIATRLFLNFDNINNDSSIAPDGLCTFRAFQSLELRQNLISSSIDPNTDEFINDINSIPPTSRIYDTVDFASYLHNAQELIDVIKRHSSNLDHNSAHFDSSIKLITDLCDYLISGNSTTIIEDKIRSLIQEGRGSVIPYDLLADPSSLIHSNFASAIHNIALFVKNIHTTPDDIRSIPGNWYSLLTYRLQGINKSCNDNISNTYATLAELLQNSVFFGHSSQHSFIPDYISPSYLRKSLDEAFLKLASSLFDSTIPTPPPNSFAFSSDSIPSSDHIPLNDTTFPWKALRQDWLYTPLVDIPAAILKQFFCSFAKSHQFIDKSILVLFRECFSDLLSKAEDFLLSSDTLNAEKYYLKALLLPSIFLTNPIKLPENCTRKMFHLQLLSEIKKDNWYTNGLLLVDIPTIETRNIQISPPSRSNDVVDVSKLRSIDKRVISYMDNNLLSKAMNALQPQPIAPANINTFEKLQDKHPAMPEFRPHIPGTTFSQPSSQISDTQSQFETLTLDSDPTNIDSIESFFTPNSMRQYISNAHKKKAPGNSNLRYEHLKQLISDSNSIDGSNFLNIYTRFCGYFASGKLPASVHSIISGGSIFGIIKPDSSIRPVVIKDTIAKSISIPLRQLKPIFSDFFFPTNLSHTPNGIEKVIHTLNNRLVNELGLDTMFIDIKNAHNSVFRDHALHVLQQHHPIFLPYFISTYNSPSSLYFNGGNLGYLPITSARGFHQGDPFASFIFCLCIHKILNDAKQLNNIQQNNGIITSYEDDISVQNSASNIVEIFNFLKSALNDIGLEINLAKTKIMMSHYQSSEESDNIFSRYLDLGLLPSNIIRHFKYFDGNNIDADFFEQKQNYGVLLLGTPVGSTEYILSSLNGKIISLNNESLALTDFRGGAHRQFTLLSRCFKMKINHLLRTLPTNLVHNFALAFDALLLTIFNKITNSTISLDSSAHKQMQLPISFGGLGLGNNLASSIAAQIASEIACFDTVKTLIPSANLSPLLFENLAVINAAIVDYKDKKNVAITEDILDSPVSIFPREPPAGICSSDIITIDTLLSLSSNFKLQKYLTIRLNRLAHTNLLSTFTSDPRNLSRLVSCSQFGSGYFLHGTPRSNTSSLLSCLHFIIAMCLRLGLKIPDIPDGLPCKDCKSNSHIDPNGDHILNCNSGERLRWHNAIVFIVVLLAKGSGAKVQTNKLNHVFSAANSESSPDIQISDHHVIQSKFKASTIFGDVRIVHPSSKSYCNHASVIPFHAANKAFASKQQKFSYNMSFCQPNATFIPLILESYGAIHPKFREFLAALVPELAIKMEMDPSVLFGYFLKKISVSLARSTASTIISARDKIYFRHPSFRQDGYPNAEAFRSDVQLDAAF